MARQVGWKNRFNSGELGPDAWADTDLQMHAAGCALAQNFIGRVSGSIGRRGGFWFAGLPKFADTRSLLIPFERSIDDALMLEFGDGYVRVWQADGSPLMNAGVQVEFASPYAEVDLAKLRPLQTGDLITIRHADGTRPKQLVRTSNTSWAFSDYKPKNGPFRTENKDDTKTVTLTKLTGTSYGGTNPGSIYTGATVKLVASDPIFDELMVGGLFALRQPAGGSSCNAWAPDVATVGGDFYQSDGKIYQNVGDDGGGHTGRNPPVHDLGTVSDGRVKWYYLSDGRGVIRIDSFVSATEVHGTVLAGTSLGDGGETFCWSEGAYSDYRGWPTAWPAIREERLVEGSTAAEPDKFDASRTAGYDTTGADFKPGLGTGRVVDDDAIRRFAGDRSARIVWFVSSTFLLAGTEAEELTITGATLDDPLSPASTTARSISDYGSAAVRPVKAHRTVLFVARGGKTLCALNVAPDLSGSTDDVSFFAEHIANRGFGQIEWTGAPDYLAWALMADGTLAAFVYNPQQKIYGWYSQALGGGFVAESLAVLPGSFKRDALWVIARREKDGVTQRVILMLSAAEETLRLDAAERYSGAPAAGVDGLDHLEGEEVTVMAGPGDGTYAQYEKVTVTDGAVTLPGGRTAAEIVAGLPYLSRYESLPADLEGPGATQGRKIRFTKMLAILTGVLARIGTTTSQARDLVTARQPSDVDTIAPRRMNAYATIEAGADREPRLVVETDSGFDLTLHAIRPEAMVNA